MLPGNCGHKSWGGLAAASQSIARQYSGAGHQALGNSRSSPHVRSFQLVSRKRRNQSLLAAVAEEPPYAPDSSGLGRTLRILVLLTGLLLPQLIMYWPSLIGQTYLLPLDNLERPNIYTPLTPEQQKFTGYEAQNYLLDDLVYAIEFRRKYAVERVRNGELPLWTPYLYCGAPFLATNNAAVFSPFRLIDYAMDSPVSHAWSHLAKVLWMGIGTYLFLRRAMGLGFWAAVIGAWSFPLAMYFQFWQGYPPSYAASWLPWILLANHAVIERPTGWGAIGLAFATGGMLVSGHAGSATHVLLISGLYAIWCTIRSMAPKSSSRQPGEQSLPRRSAGVWFHAYALKPHHVQLPATCQRVESRSSGTVEFPPMGMMACRSTCYLIPTDARAQLLLYYDWQVQLVRKRGSSLRGVAVTLGIHPLAFVDRSRWWDLGFWIFIALFASAHTLNIPGLINVLDIPPLHLLQNNRFVFVSAWAFVVMGSVGLNVAFTRPIQLSRWVALPILLILVVGAYCTYRLFVPTQPMIDLLSSLTPSAEATEFKDKFIKSFHWFHINGIILCGLALLLWYFVCYQVIHRRWMPYYFAVIIVGELLWNAYGVNAQCDPEMYYPRIPALQAIADGPPGRITGVRCLIPNLGMSHGLRDIRGYDGAYPQRMFNVFHIAQEPGQEQTSLDHPHVVMIMTPAADSPVLDMLNLRYRIHRGSPPPDADVWASSLDYWVVQNENTMPRAYIPRRVEAVADREQSLKMVAKEDFDPREIAYVEEPLTQPIDDARGSVELTLDKPEHVVLEADMETPGMVVLADYWYPAWKVYINGVESTMFHANHAIRGVEVPAGKSTIEFRYESEQLSLGVKLTLLTLLAMGCWSMGVVWLGRRAVTNSD